MARLSIVATNVHWIGLVLQQHECERPKSGSKNAHEAPPESQKTISGNDLIPLVTARADCFVRKVIQCARRQLFTSTERQIS